MKAYKLLSLDETGKASYDHPSKLFVLSGAVIPEKLKLKIDHKMRSLKKKFFNDEELVFHARDMSRKKGPFSILNNGSKEQQFWSEFISLVNNSEISFFFVVTNKGLAPKYSKLGKTTDIRYIKNTLKKIIKTSKKAT